jgi:hypothetical protein
MKEGNLYFIYREAYGEYKCISKRKSYERKWLDKVASEHGKGVYHLVEAGTRVQAFLTVFREKHKVDGDFGEYIMAVTND